jgi:hypothetical protein
MEQKRSQRPVLACAFRVVLAESSHVGQGMRMEDGRGGEDRGGSDEDFCDDIDEICNTSLLIRNNGYV